MLDFSTPGTTLALTQDQLQELRGILKRCAPEHSFWAYGSRVRSATQSRPLKPFSDLDLALCGAPLGWVHMFELRDALSESELPFRVDVAHQNDLPKSWVLEKFAL